MPADDLDLSTLRLLLAIRECGSVSRAATTRGISQPAASARIREFETRWGLGLVQRTPRGSTLTPDGCLVAGWAQDLLSAADQARRSMSALTRQRGCHLTVASSETLAENLVPGWLGRLQSEHPELVPQLAVLTSEAVLRAVRSGTADIGFIESAMPPSELAHRVVGRDRLEIVVPPNHPWSRRRRALRMDELQAARWVLRESGSGCRSAFEAAVRGRLNIALETSSTAALLDATAAGVGPGVASLLSVRDDLGSGRLIRVPHTLDLRRVLTCVWQDSQRLSDPARRLLVLATQRGRTATPST